MESFAQVSKMFDKFSNWVTILQYFTNDSGCKYLMTSLCSKSRDLYYTNQKAFLQAFKRPSESITHMQSFEDYQADMGKYL